MGTQRGATRGGTLLSNCFFVIHLFSYGGLPSGVWWFHAGVFILRRGVRGVLILSFNNRCGRLVTEHIHSRGICTRVLPCAAPVRRVGGGGCGNVVFANNPGSIFSVRSPRCSPSVLSLKVPILKVYCNYRLVT